MPILCHHSRMNHSARGVYHVLCNRHVISYDRSGVASQTSGHGLLHSSSIFLYFADAFHKAAGNTPLLISATWGIEHHGNEEGAPCLCGRAVPNCRAASARAAGRCGAVRDPGAGGRRKASAGTRNQADGGDDQRAAPKH